MELLIPAWFLIPWLVFMVLVVRASIYETRLGLFKGLQPFAFGEFMHRINERRRADPTYNRMKGAAWRWLVITAAWWAISFATLVGGALLYGGFHA